MDRLSPVEVVDVAVDGDEEAVETSSDFFFGALVVFNEMLMLVVIELGGVWIFACKLWTLWVVCSAGMFMVAEIRDFLLESLIRSKSAVLLRNTLEPMEEILAV